MLGMLAGIVIGATGNGDAVEAAVAGGNGLMMQRQINFTRGGEQEADRIGIQLLARAGFEPTAMANVFTRIQLATRRTEERRVGQGGVSTRRDRGGPEHR